MSYPPLGQLMAAHPEWMKAATMPSDLMTVEMAAVYAKRSCATVRNAMVSGDLPASQRIANGPWYTLLPDVQRWAIGLPKRRKLAAA